MAQGSSARLPVGLAALRARSEPPSRAPCVGRQERNHAVGVHATRSRLATVLSVRNTRCATSPVAGATAITPAISLRCLWSGLWLAAVWCWRWSARVRRRSLRSGRKVPSRLSQARRAIVATGEEFRHEIFPPRRRDKHDVCELRIARQLQLKPLGPRLNSF